MDAKYHRLAEEVLLVTKDTMSSKDTSFEAKKTIGEVVDSFCIFLKEQDDDFNEDLFKKECDVSIWIKLYSIP